MVQLKDLKRINILKNIPDHLLEIVAKEAHLSIFGAGTQLLTVQEKAERLYLLIMGQVAVKQPITDDIDMIMAFVQSGGAFGIAALLDNQKASYTAVCQEPCEVITLEGGKMVQLFKENNELAFYMLQAAAVQYKQNMDRRAQMIIRVLDEHPELKEEIEEIKSLTLVI